MTVVFHLDAGVPRGSLGGALTAEDAAAIYAEPETKDLLPGWDEAEARLHPRGERGHFAHAPHVDVTAAPNYRRPRVNAEWARRADEHVRDAYEYEDGDGSTISDALEHLPNLVNGSDVWVRVTEDAVYDLADGDRRLKNQHEVGSSQGFFGPNFRRAAEQTLFGVDPSEPETAAPIYGYLTSEEDGHSGNDSLAQYGDIALRLRPEVRDRTTFTLGDSLDASNVGVQPGVAEERLRIAGIDPKSARGNITLMLARDQLGTDALLTPTPMDGPYTPGALDHALDGLVDAASIDELDTKEGYVEAQIHGGVAVEDIDTVVFYDRDELDRSLVERLHDSGVRVFLYDQDTGELVSWEPDETKAVRHVRTPEGQRVFNQPIGSVIVTDPNLPHPRIGAPHADESAGEEAGVWRPGKIALYHGTRYRGAAIDADPNGLRKSPQGESGPGIYLTPELSQAEIFALDTSTDGKSHIFGSVYKVELDPGKVLDRNTAEGEAIFREAQQQAKDSGKGSDEVLQSLGYNAVRHDHAGQHEVVILDPKVMPKLEKVPWHPDAIVETVNGRYVISYPKADPTPKVRAKTPAGGHGTGVDFAVDQYKLYRALLVVDPTLMTLKRGKTHELSKRLADNWTSLRKIGDTLEQAEADGLVTLNRHKWKLAYHLRDTMSGQNPPVKKPDAPKVPTPKKPDAPAPAPKKAFGGITPAMNLNWPDIDYYTVLQYQHGATPHQLTPDGKPARNPDYPAGPFYLTRAPDELAANGRKFGVDIEATRLLMNSVPILTAAEKWQQIKRHIALRDGGEPDAVPDHQVTDEIVRVANLLNVKSQLPADFTPEHIPESGRPPLRDLSDAEYRARYGFRPPFTNDTPRPYAKPADPATRKIILEWAKRYGMTSAKLKKSSAMWAYRAWTKDPGHPFNVTEADWMTAFGPTPPENDLRKLLLKGTATYKVPAKLANEVGDVWDGLKTDYPAAMAGLRSIQFKALGARTYADYSVWDKRIRLDSKKFGTDAWGLRNGISPSVVSSIKRDELTGFHPRGCTHPGSIVSHEFGHHLHLGVLTKDQREALFERVDTFYAAQALPGHRPAVGPPGKQALNGYEALVHKRWASSIGKDLSTYAMKNEKEFLAEAFAEYRSSRHPRPLAKLVGEYIDSVLKGK